MGEAVWLYPQNEVFVDLAAARKRDGGDVRFSVTDTSVSDLTSSTPKFGFTDTEGNAKVIHCDLVVGADGSQGICKRAIPTEDRTDNFVEYPFAWFGILREAPPSADELIYCYSEHGFALIGQRDENIQRMYFQCPTDTDVNDWTEEAIWAELQKRIDGPDGLQLARLCRSGNVARAPFIGGWTSSVNAPRRTVWPNLRRDAGDAERWDIAISRSSIKRGAYSRPLLLRGSLESSWSQILVQAALAAGSADRTDAAAEILTVIQTATHHEASALLAWDPVSGAHAPLAAFDYDPHTVVALGDRYALSPEHQSLQRSHAPTRISDLPAYRTSRTFLEVIQPAEFDDGMTMAIAGSDGGYRGMLHLSATSPGTFSVEASELVAILAPVLARVCDVTRVVSLRPELPDGVRAVVMDQTGRSWPVDAVESSPLPGQPSFIGVVQRFLGSPTVMSKGTWPCRGGGWVFVELLRVAHPLTSGAVAVLVEEQDCELPYDLSPREFDILHGVARGHTNQRIASTRAISLRTVTTHIERILHKMNQESRAGAIGVALKEGFLRIDD